MPGLLIVTLSSGGRAAGAQPALAARSYFEHAVISGVPNQPPRSTQGCVRSLTRVPVCEDDRSRPKSRA
jgi:hypothetical protein